MMGIGSLIIELSNMQLIHLKGDRKREKHVFSVQHAVQRVQSKTSMTIDINSFYFVFKVIPGLENTYSDG